MIGFLIPLSPKRSRIESERSRSGSLRPFLAIAVTVVTLPGVAAAAQEPFGYGHRRRFAPGGGRLAGTDPGSGAPSSAGRHLRIRGVVAPGRHRSGRGAGKNGAVVQLDAPDGRRRSSVPCSHAARHEPGSGAGAGERQATARHRLRQGAQHAMTALARLGSSWLRLSTTTGASSMARQSHGPVRRAKPVHVSAGTASVP